MNKTFLNVQKYLISVSVVIPIYNNEKTCVELIKKLDFILKHVCKNFEIILSDDKSSDNTATILKKRFGKNKNIKISINKKNLGIAKNIMKLYKLAKYEYTLLFSVDGDWSPIDVKKLITHIYKTKSDIVIGKRNINVYSPYRRIISLFYNFLPKLLFGVNTVDAGSIKIFKSSLLRIIELTSTSVFFEAELIIRSSLLGHKISFVSISFNRKSKKTGGGGKIKLIFQSVKDLVKLRFTL